MAVMKTFQAYRRAPMYKTSEKDKVSGLGKVIKSFTAYLDTYEDDFQAEDVDPTRYYFLRPSSFPYCGFKKLLSAHAEIDAPRLSSFASTYFTQVGHTTHDVFQAFGGRGGKFVGDWECKTCGEWRRFSTKSVCDCGEPMKYHELEVKYKGIVVGHLDGLFRLDPKLGKKSAHVMVDYKTTSSSKIKMTPRASPFPYKYNVQQIESYVPMAESQYGVSIDYWLLVYLARDAPFKYGRAIRGAHMTPDDKEVIRKRINKWVKTHKRVLVAKSRADFEAVETRKLCSSLKDYDKNYREEYNVCPYVDKCFTQSQELISKALKHKVYPILDHAPSKLQKTLRELL